MNKGISVKLVVINAMIAGVYAVLTLAISPIAYSEIQFRLSEIIVFLAFYNRRYIPGLTIGCIIANLFSPMGMLDIVFGTLSTIIVCIAMYLIKNRYLAAGAGAIIPIRLELLISFTFFILLIILTGSKASSWLI